MCAVLIYVIDCVIARIVSRSGGRTNLGEIWSNHVESCRIPTESAISWISQAQLHSVDLAVSPSFLLQAQISASRDLALFII